MAEKQSIKRFIVRDPHGHIEQEDSFSVVGEVHVDIVPGYGEPYAESEYVNGILTITIHNIEGNGITEITTDSQEGDEAVNTVTIKTDANTEGVVLEVRNGKRGNGIASISEVLSPEDGGVNTHTITDTDDNEHVFHTRNGQTGKQGIQGDSAVYNPDDPDAPDFVMANTTGLSTTKAMTQKAVTDELNKKPDNIDGTHDFAISDEYGNNIAEFDGGEIKTEKFDSSKLKPADDGDIFSDLTITDGNGNPIVRFANGHLTTRNFDSSNLTPKSQRQIVAKNLYKMDFTELEDVTLGTWTNEGNHLASAGTGHSNALVINRQYCMDTKTHIYDFEVTNGSSICFGNDVMAGNGQPTSESTQKVIVDFVEQKISIIKESAVDYHKSFSLPSYAGERLRLLVSRKGRKVTATLLKLKDLSLIVELSSENWVTDRILFWEIPMIYAINGSIFLYNFQVNCDVNHAGVIMYVIGDSITEGDKVVDNAVRWTTLLQNEFPEEAIVVSGRCSGTIFHVLERLDSEAALLHPKYVMVTIGTNGQNTTALLTQAVNKIRQIGAIPILNRVPCQNGGGHTTYNAAVNSVVEELGLLSCRFDIATAINYNLSSGCDTSLFADGTHPNAAGCKRMYNRIKIDIPELFN